MSKLQITFAAAVLAMSLSQAQAQSAEPSVTSLVTPQVLEEMRNIIALDIVAISVKSQNDRYVKLPQANIEALDKQWVAERKSDDKPLIAATLSNPLSVYLARVQGRSLGLYAEIFIMDQNGLNVGQSSVTSDFWQGDEDKFQKTFNADGDVVFMDAPEWDKDAKIWRSQISFPLTEGADKKKIGAVTVEVNLTELERRATAGS